MVKVGDGATQRKNAPGDTCGFRRRKIARAPPNGKPEAAANCRKYLFLFHYFHGVGVFDRRKGARPHFASICLGGTGDLGP